MPNNCCDGWVIEVELLITVRGNERTVDIDFINFTHGFLLCRSLHSKRSYISMLHFWHSSRSRVSLRFRAAVSRLPLVGASRRGRIAARKKARFVTCDMEFSSPLTPVIGE